MSHDDEYDDVDLGYDTLAPEPQELEDDLIVGEGEEAVAVVAEGSDADEAAVAENAEPTEVSSEHNGIVRTVRRVPAAERRTRARMSSKELARLVGARARHLADPGGAGAQAYVDITGCINERQIALRELVQGRLPMEIYRQVAPDVYEVWSAHELALPSDAPTEAEI